jgi:hypothetical protein
MHKKLFSVCAAAMCLTTAFSFTACKNDNYTQPTLSGYTSSESKAESNGGFAVKKDGYVYFINGAEENTAENAFGEVTKGALCRIAYDKLTAGDFSTVETVVPMLFVAQNFDAGIYIYGDYVYYATPTTDKNLSGKVESGWLDFKRAKLDGSEAMKNYYFRLEDNTSKYRFVEVDGVVYCMYEEEGALKSYNTATETTTTLAKGIKSESFFYDTSDPTNPYAYYTMAVTKDADTAHSSAFEYDQLYRVSAATTVSVDKDKASYTATDKTDGKAFEKTYDFNETYMQEQNDTFKKENEDKDAKAPYDFEDYTTYPYVNLGQLILDGVGKSTEKTQYNYDSETQSAVVDGYNYTITGYQNGGVYFTRSDLPATSSSVENAKLFYLADSDTKTGWNAISGNSSDKIKTVANSTTNASATAVYSVDGNGNHTYYYIDASGFLYKQTGETAVRIATGLTDNTLWKVEGYYLYYYSAAEVGNSLSKINVRGTQDDYNKASMLKDEAKKQNEYTPKKLDFLTFNDSWYKPEIFGNTVLYCGAQSTGDVSYNYIYAVDMENVAAQNEAYKAVTDAIGEAHADVQNALKYYFQTGKTTVYDELKDQYSEKRQEEFTAFTARFGEGKEFSLYNAFVAQVGAMKAEDIDAIDAYWKNALTLEAEEAEEEKGLATWAIVLIVVGSVLVVATAVLVPVLVVRAKKRKKALLEEATVNAYKRKKIDTTDDKTIDVYADDEQEENAQNAEETTQE